jgi:hypothetical protein
MGYFEISLFFEITESFRNNRLLSKKFLFRNNFIGLTVKPPIDQNVHTQNVVQWELRSMTPFILNQELEINITHLQQNRTLQYDSELLETKRMCHYVSRHQLLHPAHRCQNAQTLPWYPTTNNNIFSCRILESRSAQSPKFKDPVCHFSQIQLPLYGELNLINLTLTAE